MSLYNEDELTPPIWIDQEFLAKVLREYENNEDFEIINYEISPASMKGDHYASIMFRCRVNYRFINNNSSMQKSLIIKTLPVEEGMKRDILMQSKLFETEIDMDSITLPKIEKILADCGEPTKLSAKIIYHALEPHKVIILEDLCESGYDTVRSRFLTEHEIKAVYSRLAKLHAVSYTLGHSEEHESVAKYQEGIFSNTIAPMEEMFQSSITNFLDMLLSYDEFHIFFEKVKAMQDQLEQNCKNLYRAYKLNNGKGDIYVLNHGDFHMKNMMFKFSQDNTMEDIIMVDYQISCYAPSTIDLAYSQIMMLSSDLRMRRHEFLQHYFSEFNRILKKINTAGEMPKYSEFQIGGLKYRHFTIFLMSAFLPMVVGIIGKTMEELKDIDANKFFENPDMIAKTYHTPEFVEAVRKFMPILLNEGYLD